MHLLKQFMGITTQHHLGTGITMNNSGGNESRPRNMALLPFLQGFSNEPFNKETPCFRSIFRLRLRGLSHLLGKESVRCLPRHGGNPY